MLGLDISKPSKEHRVVFRFSFFNFVVDIIYLFATGISKPSTICVVDGSARKKVALLSGLDVSSGAVLLSGYC